MINAAGDCSLPLLFGVPLVFHHSRQTATMLDNIKTHKMLANAEKTSDCKVFVDCAKLKYIFY